MQLEKGQVVGENSSAAHGLDDKEMQMDVSVFSADNMQM